MTGTLRAYSHPGLTKSDFLAELDEHAVAARLAAEAALAVAYAVCAAEGDAGRSSGASARRSAYLRMADKLCALLAASPVPAL